MKEITEKNYEKEPPGRSVCRPQEANESACSSGERVSPFAFGDRAPASIEKALYHNRPSITFEVSITGTEPRFGSTWLIY